jgi:hypothetical protein
MYTSIAKVPVIAVGAVTAAMIDDTVELAVLRQPETGNESVIIQSEKGLYNDGHIPRF